MAFLRKSLSEDSIDRYSHTWAFVLLLLLSLVTLFIPLSPSLKLRTPASPVPTSAQKGHNADSPVFKATCWVPVEFTLPMAAFANLACSSAYNDVVKGKNSSTASLLINDDDPIPMWQPDDGVEEKKLFASERSRKVREERDKMDHRTKDLITYKTPLYLFILAILLRVPHAVWSLLSTCCGCVNVDRTLAAAQSAQSLDSDGRQRVNAEIAWALGGQGRKATGLLYLLMKLMMVVVACIGIYCACHDFLAETEELQNRPGIEKSNTGIDTGMSYVLRKSINETEVHDFHDFPAILFCNFNIRQLSNIQRWHVQCVFSPEDVSRGPGSAPVSNVNLAMNGGDSGGMSEDQILLMYKALFTSVLAVFVLLVIFNVISLLAWSLTLLLTGHRTKMGLRAEASLDHVFLVAMARQNTSCSVVKELADQSAERGGEGKLMMN